MRVLIGFERFGVLREAFRARGHDAWSCDLVPAVDGSQFHYCCDVFEVIDLNWDLGIFHPDCTYLTVSAAWAFTDGPYHQRIKPETLVGAARRLAREEALQQVGRLMEANIGRVAIENPATSFISARYGKADQIIQPNQFGDDASKATGLWLRNLRKLVPTKQIAPRMVNGKPRWANQTDSGQNRLSPSPERAMLRAATYPGIAAAMAEQWGNVEDGK
jgi:hypothetical protein